MKWQHISLTFLLVLPFSLQATDWNQTRSQLEMLQKALEESARAKQENRAPDMQRLLNESNQIQADKQYRYEQQQAEQRRQAAERLAAQQRANQNSAQYKHNQELLKAIQNEQKYGYGSRGATTQSNTSGRYRPPQATTPRYTAPVPSSAPRAAGYTGNTSTYRSAPKPSGITTNQSRSTYVPSSTYDADSLDASGVGLHDVPAATTSSAPPPSGSGVGGLMPSPSCVEWKKVDPYPCSTLYGLSETICTTTCVRYSYD